jgi:ABC-2 type transport system permease protein
MASVLRGLADVFPLTYAVDGMQQLAIGGLTGQLARDYLVVAGCVVAALLLASATLRRRSA